MYVINYARSCGVEKRDFKGIEDGDFKSLRGRRTEYPDAWGR